MNSLNDYSLYWNSTLNYIYRVFWSVDLSAWTAFSPDITGTDGTTKFDHATTATKKFFKVRQIAPPGYQVRTSW